MERRRELESDAGLAWANPLDAAAAAPAPLCGSDAVSSELSRLEKIEPRIAVPTEPPIERNRVAPEVATPRSLYSTAFCTASTSTCITIPRPRPSTNM